MPRLFRCAILGWLLCALALPLRAADRVGPARPYAVGDLLVAFSTIDQHDRPFVFTPGPQRLVVSFEMSTGKAANAYLEQQPAGFLSARRTLYLANLHGMPGFVRKFALPTMRKYPHRILLADTADFLARYPKKAGHLTVVSLDDAGRITALAFVPQSAAARAFSD